jgi:hypothetical protein
MKKPKPSPILSAFRLASAALLLAAFATTSVLADVVYVTARPSPSGAGANQDGTYSEVNIGLGDTSAIASAPGRPTTSGARYWASSMDLTDTTAGVTLTPTLGVPGGIYQIDHNFSSTAGNVSTNVIFSAVCSAGGTLSFTETDKFQRAFGNPANLWQFFGYLTNDVGSANPTIDLRYQSGLVNAALQNRLLVDCFRFTLVEPCLDVPPANVTGPLGATLTNVNVIGVVTNATSVAAYQDSGSGMVKIGEIAVSNPDASVLVPVTGLVQGAQVAATQTVGGQESCVPASGTLVGGGPNPTVRVVMTVRENTSLEGPVGAAGSGGIVSFIGASSTLTGGAPEQGIILQPSTNWQTVSFTNGVHPMVTWFGTDPTPGTWDGPFGALDGFAFASEGDNGPFEIYIDDLENGTHGIFQDWESVEAGTTAHGFSPPRNSGSSSAHLMTLPNVSEVTTAAAASGTKSLRVSWQFLDNANTRWVRLVTTGATPVANPQVDVTQPVSFKILILPPGESLPELPPGELSISLIGGDVHLDWTGTYQLQSATSVDGPYSDVVGVTTAPYSAPVGTGAVFYRLRQPAN